MKIETIHKGEFGFTIEMETGQVISGAASASILYQKPSGAKGSWPAQIVGSKLVYRVQQGDINESGTWQLQAYIQSADFELYGDKVTINVVETLE